MALQGRYEQPQKPPPGGHNHSKRPGRPFAISMYTLLGLLTRSNPMKFHVAMGIHDCVG